jgi:hypothetical protein
MVDCKDGVSLAAEYMLTLSLVAASMGSKAACSSQSQSSRSSRLRSWAKGWMRVRFFIPSLTQTAWLFADTGLAAFGGGLAGEADSLDSSGMASSVLRSASRSRGMLAGDGRVATGFPIEMGSGTEAAKRSPCAGEDAGCRGAVLCRPGRCS